MRFSYDHETHRVSMTPGTPRPGSLGSDPLWRDEPARALTRERFYFVMADRFANGSTANDTAGITGGRLATGSTPRTRASTTAVTSPA